MRTLEQLISQMKNRGVLTLPELESAFWHVDRRDFVPPEVVKDVYLDQPLPIGRGQTISQPSTVAFMLELLQPGPGHRVLDVGAGSCWTSALMAWMVGEQGQVIALERIGALAVFGRTNLERAGWPQVQVIHANGFHGWKESAPYDRILVSASASQVPDALVNQMETEGRLVIPLRDLRGTMMMLEKNADGSLTEERHPGFAFVPFVEEGED